MNLYKSVFKRLFDVVFVLIAVIILSPVYIVLHLIYVVGLRQNPIYSQIRPGKNASLFKLYKYKTMNDNKDENGMLLPDKYRITKLGKFLRATSLDELPQLFNILKGNMSIVGPRPLMPAYLSLYTKEQARRHDVYPGLTGWTQVNGRNNIPWKQKFELDIWYVDHLSFLLDMKIILLTIKKVLLREGVSKEGHATTEAFNGKN